MPERLPQEWRVPEDFPTIQAAIDAAGEGDTILISPGVYREHLVISKGVTLQGSGPTETILEGEPSKFERFWEEEPRVSAQGPFFVPLLGWVSPHDRKPTIAPPAIVVQTGQVQIRSLQIRPQGLQQVKRSPLLMALQAGIVVERGAEALLEHVTIRHAHYGAFVRRGASLMLRRSILYNWRIGVEIWGRAIVEDSSLHNEDIYEFEGSEQAIIVNGEGQAILKRNRFSIFHINYEMTPPHRIGDFCDGAVLVESGELVLEGNQIVGDWHYGILLGKGKAVIRDNLVIYRGDDSYSYGLNIPSGEATVEGNTVLAMMPHGTGMKIEPGAQATVRRNRLSQNGIGIEVVGAVAQLVENDVYANKNGIQLTHHWEGDRHVELVRNRVSQNEECGITVQSFRYVAGERVDEIFAGQLTGEGNEVQDNLQADLCPSNYPWPVGFRK